MRVLIFGQKIFLIFYPSLENSKTHTYYHRQHDGGPYGVSPDLAEKLAEKLGIGVELIPFEGPGVLADALNDNGMVHQIVSPISNSESTNFFNEYLLSIVTGKLGEKTVLDQQLVFFFNCSNWEKFLEKKSWKNFVKTSDEFVNSMGYL